MDTGALKKFAQAARRQLLEQVAARMEQVLQTDSVEIREKEEAAKELQEQIKKTSKETVIDRVAYTWFNRFCALRYMDVNHYTSIGIISPVDGFTQPEILQEAKQGVIDDSFKVDKQKVVGLLNGQLPSSNPQQEAYRLLLVGACNAYHAQMPFLFPKIDDYTELLMPDDLLSENSVLQAARDTLTEDVCQDVEVIGWLYQFYISERKDEIFSSKKPIEPKDIPAVTQLFTPHYIVRYLVENSLGRLWMLNNSNSNLFEQMDFFIQPEEPESDFLGINSPEEIKVCDPACGSGHMLTYAFDLLYSIYEEEGYDPVEIPSLILKHNLFGIEIDQRAGSLAAFALLIKARQKDRRFFNRGIDPNICVLENISFTADEIIKYKEAVGPDLFTQNLWFLVGQFEQAGNFGSLIRPQVKNPAQILSDLEELGMLNDMFLMETNRKVKLVLKFAQYLSSRYHTVIANPPYLEPKNTELKRFAKDQYANTKSDLGVMFIERNLELVKPTGLIGMVNLQSWMFLSSYGKFRSMLLYKETILSMAHLGARAFDSIGGEIVSTTATIIQNKSNQQIKGEYFRLVNGRNEAEKQRDLKEAIQNPKCGWFFRASSDDFKKIPGSPIAYWVDDKVRNAFSRFKNFSDVSIAKQGLATGNNRKFLRVWHEVNYSNIAFDCNSNEEAIDLQAKWVPYNKGGDYRKWYGGNDHVVFWSNGGNDIKNHKDTSGKELSRFRASNYYFKEALTWGLITSGKLSARYRENGYVFDITGMSVFGKNLLVTLGLLNSKTTQVFLSLLNPTLAYQLGDIRRIPFPRTNDENKVNQIVQDCINIQKENWVSHETAWDFTTSPLTSITERGKSLRITYDFVYNHWMLIVTKIKNLEEENNRIFIEAYDMQNDLIPDTPLSEITLSINPHYRYKGKKKVEERKALLLADTMREFISYAVGCMLGRYSLDKEGLILANAGENLNDYLRQVPEPSFMPDEDNVIPVLKGEWFEDDIAERLKGFLKVPFGEENFEENLTFLEEAIGRDIRSYFVKDFYNHHVKMYKKRPIYWLFSSPKGSFNALIYMHRYRPDTLSLILNDYLVQYREKLAAHRALLETRSISTSASQGEKTKTLKEIDRINKILSELKEYEDEILYPLATQQIEIDLDDGVKVNYNKFGRALKRVAGLSEKS